jgi:hypothetical protein
MSQSDSESSIGSHDQTLVKSQQPRNCPDNFVSLDDPSSQKLSEKLPVYNVHFLPGIVARPAQGEETTFKNLHSTNLSGISALLQIGTAPKAYDYCRSNPCVCLQLLLQPCMANASFCNAGIALE